MQTPPYKDPVPNIFVTEKIRLPYSLPPERPDNLGTTAIQSG